MSNVGSLKDSARSRRIAQRKAKHNVVSGGLGGGRYKPLSDFDMVRIHQTALTILAEIGMGNATSDIIDIATAKGALLSPQGRLCFPQALIEDLIAKANKDFILHARNPEYDAHIKDGNVYFRTTGEAVTVLDYKTRSTRPSTLLDVYDFARLADQLDNIHTFGQTVVATEYSNDAYVHDINVLYAQISGTQKHTAVSTATADHVDAYIRMLDFVAGGEGEFVKRPFVLFGGCPVVSPLRFGTENAEVLVRCARRGVPYDIAVASQAGATAPAALAGSLAQTFAETLAAMAIVHLINPTSPFLVGSWPFISDLRTGAFTGGSGEQALVAAASAQLINFYGLPSSLSACMTDAKLPDNQAGFEKGITASLVAHAGGNYIGEAFGMLGSLMACSFEAMIIDNDMVGNILRTLRGIEVNDDTLSLDVIRETVFGAGHFLGHAQTLQLMETEYLYPHIADRQSYGLWEQTGKKDAFERAHEEAKKMLAAHYPVYLDASVDEKIRAAFPIVLKKEDMHTGNGRW